MFGLIGPDGAGKTTTIRMICGLLAANAGSLSVLGLDPVRQHGALTSSVGYLSQRFSLYADLSVDENIALLRRHSRHQRATTDGRDRLLATDSADTLPPAACRAALGRYETEARAGLHTRPRAAI